MKIVWKCCIRNLKENRGRTIVTILGVALATGLITAAACLLASLLTSYTYYVKQTNGDTHAFFGAVAGKDLKLFLNNQSFEQTWIARREGYAELKKEKKYDNVDLFLEVLSVDPDWFSHHDSGLQLYKGRLPFNDGEIVLDRKLRNELGMDIEIGDEITLSLGERTLHGQPVRYGSVYSEEEELQIRSEKNYVVVGLTDEQSPFKIEKMGRHSNHYYAKVYRAFAYLDEKGFRENLSEEISGEKEEILYDVSVRFTKNGLKHFEEIIQALLGISAKDYDRVLSYGNPYHPSEEDILSVTEMAKEVRIADAPLGLIHLESGKVINQQNYAMIFLLVMVFLIFIFAGVFCINNSFDLTFTERIRYYGMMASVGTTKRQRRKMILCEGAVIGAHGIPLGILFGLGITLVLVLVTNTILRIQNTGTVFKMHFGFSFLAIGLSVVLSVFMIWLSASESAARAAKLTPMAALRLNEEVKAREKIRQKRFLNPFRKLLGADGNLAFLNYQRARIKYRASVTSIAISVILILGVSFVRILYGQMEAQFKQENKCQLTFAVDGGEHWNENFQRLKELLYGAEGIERATISSSFALSNEEESIPYLPGKPESEHERLCIVRLLDENSFALLCEEAGVDYEEAKGKGIVNAAELHREKITYGVEKTTLTGKSIASFQKGDIICGEIIQYLGKIDNEWKTKSFPLQIEVAVQDDTIFSLDDKPIGAIFVYVGESWLEQYPEREEVKSTWSIYGAVLGENVNALEDSLYDAKLSDLFVNNYYREWKRMETTKLLILIFLFSALFLIAMIAVTNVINAIGTNLELRAREFARLRSIGMTMRQLCRMVRLEMVIIGGKGFIYGIVFGSATSYALYRFVWEASDKSFPFAFRFPCLEALLCLVAVGLILALITEGRIRKLLRKNIVETLRNENL